LEKNNKKALNGAEALIECLEKKGVEYIFGYPGGAAIPIFDAIYDSSIELILVDMSRGQRIWQMGMLEQQVSPVWYW